MDSSTKYAKYDKYDDDLPIINGKKGARGGGKSHNKTKTDTNKHKNKYCYNQKYVRQMEKKLLNKPQPLPNDQ